MVFPDYLILLGQLTFFLWVHAASCIMYNTALLGQFIKWFFLATHCAHLNLMPYLNELLRVGLQSRLCMIMMFTCNTLVADDMVFDMDERAIGFLNSLINEEIVSFVLTGLRKRLDSKTQSSRQILLVLC